MRCNTQATIRLLLSLTFCFQAGVSWAQQSQTQNVPYVPEITPDEIRAKTSELSSQPIPEREQLLLRELDRINSEVAHADVDRSKANSWASFKATMEKISSQLLAKSRAIAHLDCDKDSSRIFDATRTYSRLIGTFARNTNDDTIEFDKIYLPVVKTTDEVQYCKLIKTAFSSTDFTTALQDILNSVQNNITTFVTQQASLSAEYNNYLDMLKKRRASVQDKLNSAQSVSQISGNLPLLLGILGFACVSTILGIKLFGAELQMEWVASGQVIQFVTVMILLSVILALGLSNILKENTLGTLLGGIAGYVLAQGVGRAAARDVTRSRANPGGAPNATPRPVQPPAE